MNEYLMLEVARQRMADQAAAARRASVARKQRAAARQQRAAARERRTDMRTVEAIAAADSPAGAAWARVPAPREEHAAGERVRAGRR